MAERLKQFDEGPYCLLTEKQFYPSLDEALTRGRTTTTRCPAGTIVTVTPNGNDNVTIDCTNCGMIRNLKAT